MSKKNKKRQSQMRKQIKQTNRKRRRKSVERIVNENNSQIYFVPWENKTRATLPPSRERLEIFLKEVGSKNPFDFIQGEDMKLSMEKKTNDYLWFNWRETMGLSGNEKDVLDFECKEHIVNNEAYDWFVELEHLITNNKMFWCLMGCCSLWCKKSQIFTDNPTIFERYGRDKVPLQTKMKCLEYLKVVRGNKLGKNSTSEISWKRLEEKNVDDEITLYRTFKVQQGKNIRKGVFKKNNPFSHIQEAGKGWSYSTCKTNSIFVNGLLSTFYYKKYLKVSDTKAKILLKNARSLSNKHMEDPTLYDGYYNVLGEYKVKKKDILFYTNDWSENEVVVNPNKVHLIDYRFLNITDFITEAKCRAFGSAFGKDFTRTSIVNLDGFYDVVKKTVQKMIKKYPHIIKNHLRGSIKRAFEYKEFLEFWSYGRDFTFDVYSIDGGNEFYMLGVEDKNGTLVKY